ncbi:MAG TPA: hypothetical protein VFH27_15130 [Longimicrobiaceae bacterium]|nr:hypothetical protein [Longimicrobiaceae bacterium]
MQTVTRTALWSHRGRVGRIDFSEAAPLIMIQLPELHELTWLFEAEPELLDPGVAIWYNTVTLTTTRGEDRISCVIRPAADEVDLVWSRDGRELTRLELGRVAEVGVLRDGDRDVLRVSFRDGGLQPLHLRLKPTVHLAWQMVMDS